MRNKLLATVVAFGLVCGAFVGCGDDDESTSVSADGGGGAGGAIVLPDAGVDAAGGGTGAASGAAGSLDGGGGAGGSTDTGTAASVITCVPATTGTNTAIINAAAAGTVETMSKTSTLPGAAYPALPAL